MTIDPKDLEKVTGDAIMRYSKRFGVHGYDVRSLGWGTREQQEYRFTQTLLGPADPKQKTILDIGCGFGDYYKFLENAGIAITHYEGWDINPDLISEAKKQYKSEGKIHFDIINLMDENPIKNFVDPKTDIVIMLGLLNFNLGEIDNYAYSELAIRRAFALSKETLIVDFLSAVKDPLYPSESAVFYHDPERMLAFALTLSPKVTLKHNYASIPQREFMLFIEK